MSDPVLHKNDTNQKSSGDQIPLMNTELYKSTVAKTIRTTCPYCGVGCGVLASVASSGEISVKGDPDHPANFGKLCSKGSALAQTLGTKRRLTQPYYQNKPVAMQHRQPRPSAQSSHPADRQYVQKTESTALRENADWDTVLDDIAERFNDTIAKHGRDSIMFYVSGQLLTEDYYVANKFIKGFIGNNNIDSNSRLCMSSAVAGYKRAFGADLVPGNYEDLESCELLVLVGSNMAWCHPILFGRFLDAKKSDPNKKLIIIDPRRTDSCEFADLHVPIAAGTDTHLYNGLLHYLAQQGYQNDDYARQSIGLPEALQAAQGWTIARVAEACQVPVDSIRQFYELVAAHDKTVTAFSMGVNQSSSGTDKVNAIINTHLFTGRVGKLGASPFSLTGQPNAMGGREVGALANLLAAHLDLDNAVHRQLVANFWEAPQAISPDVGIKACDAADAILDGRIKAIWIMATNPVVSLPEADRFRQALAECDLVIVSDCSVDSDTVHCADIVLPAQGWGEKSGTVTNSERRISRQRALMPAAGVAKPDWWILSQVAKRMGMTGFEYQHPSEIFNEHVALTDYGNAHNQAASINNQPRYLNLSRDLSLLSMSSNQVTVEACIEEYNETAQSFDAENKSTATPVSLSDAAYDAMPPFQWGAPRISMINTACTMARLVAITPSAKASMPNAYRRRLNPLGHSNKKTYDSGQQQPMVRLRLITGRLRDQWHTMTRTGLAPQLNQHQPTPMLTIHPNDAHTLGLQPGDFVQVHRQYQDSTTDSYAADSNVIEPLTMAEVDVSTPSRVLAQVMISDTMRVGDAFIPMHWSNAFASDARMGTLIPTVVDPHSGQPELKNSAISITSVPMCSFGRILVHPDWQDAVIVQLRNIMANMVPSDSADEPLVTNTAAEVTKSSSGSLPALTWSLSHQIDSVLINVASPNIEVSRMLANPEFWQQFAKSLSPLQPLACSKLQPPLPLNAQLSQQQTNTIHTAFTVNSQQNQLRLIVTQSVSQTQESASNNTRYAIDTQGLSPTEPSEQLLLAIYFSPNSKQLPSARWLDSCFSDANHIPIKQRYKWLLAGRPASGYVDPGALVCSCMSVGENTIINAITKQGCHSAIAVGKQCRAGTNCGSCVGQINALIATYALEVLA